jgi:hypothetical protein
MLKRVVAPFWGNKPMTLLVTPAPKGGKYIVHGYVNDLDNNRVVWLADEHADEDGYIGYDNTVDESSVLYHLN